MFRQTTRSRLIVSLILSLTSVSAFASNQDSSLAPKNAYEAQGKQNSDQFVQTLNSIATQQDLSNAIKLSLNNLVHEGTSLIAFYGDSKMANRINQDWQRLMSARDLGDHKPLNAWLGNFMKTLEAQVGIEKLKQTRLYDINVINYGIPVVLHPKGNPATQETWDKYEYQQHFVPVFGTVTYWGSYGVCLYASTQWKPEIKPYCKKISTAAEKIGYLVSADISDSIFDNANGKIN